MPNFRPSPDLDMHYEVDDFTDPWRQPETILMLHGNAESGLAWYAWVPELARHYRVVRPDMRGFGESTAMPRDYPWTLDRLIDDFCLLMDHLGIDRFHLVGAKIGGTIARAFAARRPERVITLTVVGTPPPLRVGAAERVPRADPRCSRPHGVEHWARQNMGDRLGSAFPPEGVEWWTQVHGPHRGLDPDRLHGHDRLRRHPRRPAEDRLPDAGHHHRGERAWHGRRRRAPGSSRSRIRAAGPARQFLPRRRDACRPSAAATLDFIARRGGSE